MHAVAIEQFGGRDQMAVMDLPDPKVGPDSVLVRVAAAGLNPVDWKMREGGLDARFPHRFPVILGWDAAGVIEQVGPAVVDLKPGDAVYVYARKTEVSEGTYAELLSVPDGMVARAPSSLSPTEAGAVPLAGLTALQALDEALGVGEGDTVVVQAAAGGVGHFAVQIASARGARVVGVASERNHDFVRSLGAEAVVDHHAGSVADQVLEHHPGGVDALFDLFGGDGLADARSVVREGGRVTSLADTDPAGDRDDLMGRYVFVRPSAPGLVELGRLADAGQLRVEIAEGYPLDRAAAAHERLEDGHVRGKLVLEVA